MYSIQLTRQAEKDAMKIAHAGLKSKTTAIIRTVRINPYEESQGFEKLQGDLKGAYSRRINRQHRFVYEILPNTGNLYEYNGKPFQGIVKIISMWTHYEQ